MGMQIASTMTVDSASSGGNCVWNPQPLAGTPSQQPADKKIYVEGALLQYYTTGAVPALVPGSGISCAPMQRSFDHTKFRVQRVKWNGKPIALIGDSAICGSTSDTRELTTPGIGATIHIGTRRGG